MSIVAIITIAHPVRMKVILRHPIVFSSLKISLQDSMIFSKARKTLSLRL